MEEDEKLPPGEVRQAREEWWGLVGGERWRRTKSCRRRPVARRGIEASEAAQACLGQPRAARRRADPDPWRQQPRSQRPPGALTAPSGGVGRRERGRDWDRVPPH